MSIRGFFLILLAFPASWTGCCNNTHVQQPIYPSDIPGWRDIRFSNGVHSIGVFVLAKNESSDNGQVGITIIDVILPDRCAEPGSWQGEPRVVLKLFNPSKPSDACQTTMGTGGHSVLASACGSTVGLAAINIIGINSNDRWVHLELISKD
jgi:hypothetical protein